MKFNFGLLGFEIKCSIQKVGNPQQLLAYARTLPKRTESEVSWKIALIKSVRHFEGLRLKEAKDKIDQMFDKGIYRYTEGLGVSIHKDGSIK